MKTNRTNTAATINIRNMKAYEELSVPKMTVGLFRPTYQGNVEFKDGRQSVILIPSQEQKYTQTFHFRYTDGKSNAEGNLLLNRFSGEVTVKGMNTSSFYTISQLPKFVEKVNKELNLVAKAMGVMCFQSLAKKVKQSSPFKVLGNLLLGISLPAKTWKMQKMVMTAASATDGTPMYRYGAEVWVRAGSWCVSSCGKVYWRKGAVCTRKEN